MAPRYLFGPVTPAFAADRLGHLRRDGHCLAFNASGGADLTIGHTDTWADVLAGLPPGWAPDFVALHLPYGTLPEGLLDAPVPLVAVAPEGRLLWHYYRHRLPLCDAAIMDAEGAERAEREGLAPAVAADLGGCPAAWADAPVHHDGRDIDLLLVANLNPAVQPQRVRWLPRLAGLAERYHVVVRAGVFGAEYERLLSRARVVFSHLRPGGGYRRLFESAAAGALVLQEAGDARLSGLLPDGRGCVYFRPEEFEAVARRYLDDEGERRRVVEAGREAVRRCTYPVLWEEVLQRLGARWPEVLARSRQRGTDLGRRLAARAWQALYSPAEPDRGLVADLEREVPGGPTLRGLLGLVRSCRAHAPADRIEAARLSAECFRAALAADPADPLAATNLAAALAASGQKEEATRQARTALNRLALAPVQAGAWLGGGVYPPAFGVFRAEWERLAFDNPGGPDAEAAVKARLLRWRLHGLLLELTGALAHAYEAFHARPDLPAARAALGRALAGAGQPWEALGYLRRAVEENPCDRLSARVLHDVLRQTLGDPARFPYAHQRHLLSTVAPRVFPAEGWFREGPAELPAVPIEVPPAIQNATTR